MTARLCSVKWNVPDCAEAVFHGSYSNFQVSSDAKNAHLKHNYWNCLQLLLVRNLISGQITYQGLICRAVVVYGKEAQEK